MTKEIDRFYQARDILGESYLPQQAPRFTEIPTFMRVPHITELSQHLKNQIRLYWLLSKFNLTEQLRSLVLPAFILCRHVYHNRQHVYTSPHHHSLDRGNIAVVTSPGYGNVGFIGN